MMYHALISSHVNYCLPIWQSLTKKSENHLQALLNKGIRACFCLKGRESTKEICKANNILSFRQQCKYMSLLLVKSTRNSDSPKHLKSLFQEKIVTRQLRTSNDDLLQVPNVKTKKLQLQSSYLLPQLWNQTSSKMKSLKYQAFKDNIKKMILNEDITQTNP